MGNLFERFRKKENVRRISNVEKLNYERSKNMSDILRPIDILSTIFGLRFLGFSRGRFRPIFSFLYSMTLFCLYVVGRFYLNNNRIIGLHKTIFHMTTIIHHMLIIVILIIGLYRSNVSPKIVFDVC